MIEAWKKDVEEIAKNIEMSERGLKDMEHVFEYVSKSVKQVPIENIILTKLLSAMSARYKVLKEQYEKLEKSIRKLESSVEMISQRHHHGVRY